MSTQSLSLGPRLVERPGDSGVTLIGALDDQAPTSLDRGGLVQPYGASFSIDWWIGADDRWYFPSREATVRQRRLGPGPVIETAVRIPSGDALHRCYPVSVGGGTATVIEIENDSPVPVALAMAIRPYDIAGRSSHAPVAITDDRVTVGDAIALCLPRRANERLATNREAADIVVAGTALTGAAECAGEQPNGVVLYPLPHRTKLRFVVPDGPRPIDPSSVPDSDAVQRGWASVVERGGRFDLPDNGLGERAGAARARLLLANDDFADRLAAFAPGVGRVFEALVVSGASTDLRVPLLTLASSFPRRLEHPPAAAAAVVAGAGRAVAVLDDGAMAEELLEVLAATTKLVERSGDQEATADAFRGLGWALLAAGQPEPAADLFGRADVLATSRSDVGADLEALTPIFEAASAAGSWGLDDDIAAAATFWLGVRGLAVAETPDRLHLLPSFPTAWRGGSVEVHEAATTHGKASFAIRWHGYRPALLWDLDLHRGVEVRCPALDPEWSTTEPKGEALLAGVADELPAPPAEGESFA
jgi:hypothetical protein